QTVQYLADPQRGFQPSIGYEIEGDNYNQRSTNDHLQFQYPQKNEDIRRTFPANEEIVVDQLWPQMIDNKNPNHYKNVESLGSNNNIPHFPSIISKPPSQLSYSNGKQQIIGTPDDELRNESKSQIEISNIYEYNDSNTFVSNEIEIKPILLNNNTSNAVVTLKNVSQTYQYEPILIVESNKPSYTNKSKSDVKLYAGHKQPFQEFNEQNEFYPEYKYFTMDSREIKANVDSQLFEGNFEVQSVKVNEKLKNYETSDISIKNDQDLRNVQLEDSSKITTINHQYRNTIKDTLPVFKDKLETEKDVIKKSSLEMTHVETNKNEKDDNVNLPNSSRQLKIYQSNNYINNSKETNITSNIGNRRKRVQLLNHNTEIENIRYSPFNDHTIPDSELDAHLAIAIGGGFGSKVSHIPSSVLAKTYNENVSIIHEDSRTQGENNKNVSNKNSLTTMPMYNVKHQKGNKNVNNSYKLQKVPISIYSNQEELSYRNTEDTILASEMYLNDNHKNYEIHDMPHEKLASLMDYDYRFAVDEKHENHSFINKHKLNHTELNLQNNENSSYIYTQNIGDSVLKDTTKSGNSNLVELRKKSEESLIYDSDITYEYQYDDYYENYDTFHHQTENHNDEKIETIPNSNEKIQKTSVDSPTFEFESSNKEGLLIKPTEGVQAVTIEKALNEYQYDDYYENYDPFHHQTENHNEEEMEKLPNSKERIQKTSVYSPTYEFESSDKEGLLITPTEGVQAVTMEKELTEYQYDDYYDHYDTFHHQTGNHNDEEMEKLPNSIEGIQKASDYLPTFEFENSDEEGLSIKPTEGVQAVTREKELNISNIYTKDISGIIYLPDEDIFISRPTPVQNLLINQTSERYETNNNTQNETNYSKNEPITIEDDILEYATSYSSDPESEYLYDETSEIYESEYDSIIEENSNVTDYEFEDTHGNTYDTSTIKNVKQPLKNYTEHNQMTNIDSEKNIYDFVSISPIKNFPTEILSEIVEEIEPNFQTHQPNIVILEANQPDIVDFKSRISVTKENGIKKYKNSFDIPSEYQSVPKRKFTRLNKESILRQLPERFKQFSVPATIDVISDHENHPHRPTKNLVTKQNIS
ncbi:unnamed protein product, partial [Meganyctiphanes norvegica]